MFTHAVFCCRTRKTKTKNQRKKRNEAFSSSVHSHVMNSGIHKRRGRCLLSIWRHSRLFLNCYIFMINYVVVGICSVPSPPLLILVKYLHYKGRGSRSHVRGQGQAMDHFSLHIRILNILIIEWKWYVCPFPKKKERKLYVVFNIIKGNV